MLPRTWHSRASAGRQGWAFLCPVHSGPTKSLRCWTLANGATPSPPASILPLAGMQTTATVPCGGGTTRASPTWASPALLRAFASCSPHATSTPTRKFSSTMEVCTGVKHEDVGIGRGGNRALNLELVQTTCLPLSRATVKEPRQIKRQLLLRWKAEATGCAERPVTNENLNSTVGFGACPGDSTTWRLSCLIACIQPPVAWAGGASLGTRAPMCPRAHRRLHAIPGPPPCPVAHRARLASVPCPKTVGVVQRSFFSVAHMSHAHPEWKMI
jgi:hypothetical protein